MREEKRVITYKCDRCPKTCTRTHYEHPEKKMVADDERGWLFVHEATHFGMGPPSTDETRKKERTDKPVQFMLCPACAELFNGFMNALR